MNIKTVKGNQIKEMFYNGEFFDILGKDIDGNRLLGFTKYEALQSLNAFCSLNVTIEDYIKMLLISNNLKELNIIIYWRYLIDAKEQSYEIQQTYKIIRNMLMIGAIIPDHITQEHLESLNFDFDERFFKFKNNEIFWTGLVEYYYSKICDGKIINADILFTEIEKLDQYFGFKIQDGNLIKYQNEDKMNILKQNFPKLEFKEFSDEIVNPLLYGNSEIFDQIEIFWKKISNLVYETTSKDMHEIEEIPFKIDDIWKTLIIKEIPINFKFMNNSN